MLRLEIRNKIRGSSVFESPKSAVFLGRDRSMDVVIDDPLVSRQHAVIIARGAEYVLQDVGGKNPVRVNGADVLSHTLAAGDRIELGDTLIVFNGSEAQHQQPAADFAPTVVDARRSLELFRDEGVFPDLSADDTAARLVQTAFLKGERRSRRNLRILENFCSLIRSLSDRRKLLGAALDTMFDNLEVRRGFVGFFAPSGHVEIEIEQNQEGRDREGRDRKGGDRKGGERKGGDGKGGDGKGGDGKGGEGKGGEGGGGAQDGGAQDAHGQNGREQAGREHQKGGRGPSAYSHSFVERVRREGVAILFSDAAEPDDVDSGGSLRDAKSVVRLNIKSAMCLPLFRADEVVGVLYLDNRERSESFSQEDLYFANILAHLISIALEKEELYEKTRDENIELRTILQQKNRFVGVSAASKDLLRKIKKVAAFDTTVLIIGESGTGKELVARAIHDRSPRKGQPFVAVNCAAIPETLLESELFGYAAKSGISGSDPRGKPGKFELAHGGTLFLDEIGDMSLSTQAKILRVLEERVVDRLGGMGGIHVDLRIVAATNKVLETVVEEGAFREDLYYRLKVFKVDLLPLRERREDILPLCQHYLSLHQAAGRAPLELSPRAKELLLAYHWPGNVRELKNCIEEAILLSNGRTIYPENLPSDLRRNDIPQPFGTLADVESQHIGRVLQMVNWNKRRAAEILGINRSTLYEKIRIYGLERFREGETEAPGDRAVEVHGAVGDAER